MTKRLPGKQISSLWLAVLMALPAIHPARAVDRFAFRDGSRHVLAFAVPGTDFVPAIVDHAGATQTALDWARRFYHVADLDVVDVASQVAPTRFWKVTFSARGQTVPFYAVVLPDGRPVEPTVRDEM